MADALQAFVIVAPAGNGVRQTSEFHVDLGPSIVRRILITWPAGCGGLVFIQIQAGGGWAFPNQQDQFLAFDDYTYAFDVSNQTNNGTWSVVLYNLDYIQHDPIVLFEYDYLKPSQANTSMIPVSL